MSQIKEFIVEADLIQKNNPTQLQVSSNVITEHPKLSLYISVELKQAK